MLQLKVGPQGIRGKVGQGLDLQQVIDLACAFATWLAPDRPVVVARDTRPSSPMLTHAVLSALSACGRAVLDAGICPTAVAQHEARLQGAGGAISVTASHNDATWNGLKLFGPGGRVLTSGEGKEILDLWHQGDYDKAPYDRLGAVRDLEDVIDRYLEHVGAVVDRERIADAKLRVVVDACNGAGAMVVPRLFRQLGVELIPISCEPSGRFPHPPDPTAANMEQVAAIVEPVGAHVGFGLSSDCERISLVTDRGVALGTSATLPLVAQQVLGNGGGSQVTVVAGAAVDSRVEQVAREHGARVVRCGVGIQAVVEQMELVEAEIGGEWSGGVALSRVQRAFDGLAVMARLLESVARERGSQQLADRLPVAHTRTAAVPCPVSRAYSAVARLREQATGKVIDRDGLRVEREEGWYYVRVSHTEPVIRIICEAKQPRSADELIDDLTQRIRSVIGDGS